MDNSNKAFFSYEIEDFLTSKGLNVNNCTMLLENIPKLNYNLDKIFNDRFFTVIYITNHNINPDSTEESIGHFTLLSHNDGSLEFFDSTGQKPPKIILDLVNYNQVELFSNEFPLQKINTYTCPKWVISRILSLPTSLSKYLKIFTKNKSLSPDDIVDSLYVLKVKK